MIELKSNKKVNILIENTIYSLFVYLLIKKEWEKSIFILNNKTIDIRILRKLNKYELYIYKFYDKKNFFKYFREYFKLYKFLYKINLFNKITFYGNDNLDYFIFFKNKIILLEDGLLNYQLKKITLKSVIKNILLLKPLFFRSYGYSKYVKKIYLTGLAPIPEEIKDKVEIINLKELWSKKIEEEKKEILDIFGFDENIINKIKNKKNILFTQPLSEDRFISEEEKVELYRKIIFNYPEKDLVIKTHPREKTDYKKYFPKIEILNQSFPAELFDLLDIKFETAITIFSTAALNFSKNSKVDFYGTKVHPNLLKQWGDSEKIMKANKFLNGEPINE